MHCYLFCVFIHFQYLFGCCKDVVSIFTQVPRDAASLVTDIIVFLLSGLLLPLGGRVPAQVVRAQHLGLGGAAQWSGGEDPHPRPHQARHGHARPQEGHHC